MNRSDDQVTHIPDKVYFRIGEVSDLIGVDTHVLRYWETEFKIIKPYRAKSKQRLYRRKDVENLLLIKFLLHEEGYTISGARKRIKASKGIDPVILVEKSTPIGETETSKLAVIKGELKDIMDTLKGDKSNKK